MLINTIADHLSERIKHGDLSNEELVQLIELIGSYLNLQTIPDYARRTGMSYNGVKKTKNIISIFNIKFVIDND